MKKITVKTIVIILVTFAVIALTAVGIKFLNKNYSENSYPLKYKEEVEAAAEKYGVDEALIFAVIKTESDFDPNAKSHAGAIGLMQLVPDTFTWMQTYYKDENSYVFEDLCDPALNIDYGTEVLSVLLKMYENEETAVCAYNAGLGNVDNWLKDPDYSDNGKTLKEIPFPESKNYVRLVERNKSIYSKLYFDKK